MIDLVSIASIVASCTAAYIGYLNHRGIKEVKVATDGITHQLVTGTDQRSYAEGVKDQTDNHPNIVQEKTETKAKATKDAAKPIGDPPSI